MKHTIIVVTNVIGIVAAAMIMFFLTEFVVLPFLYNTISGLPSSMTLEEWLGSFKKWSYGIIVLSFGCAMLWFALGEWAFSLNDHRKAGKRHIWALLTLLAPILAIVAGITTPSASEGMWAAYLLYLLNAIIPYYLGTLLFSPSSFKFTPVGAKWLRRW